MATNSVQTPAPAAQAPVVNIGAANPLRIAELRLGRTLDPAEPGFQDTVLDLRRQLTEDEERVSRQGGLSE